MTLNNKLNNIKIVKRDGSQENFNPEKIRSAIQKAFIASGYDVDEEKFDEITNEIVDRVIFEDKYPEIEAVQDVIEQVLLNKNYFNVARNYIRYREQHRMLRSSKKAYVDAIDSISDYVNLQDWRINANANQGYSLGGMILNVSGKMTANYWLKCVYSPEIGNAHLNGDFYIHDLDMFSGYCAGWSLRQLLNEGLNGVPNKIECAPPKHFDSALGQMVNFLGTLQNEWAGAQAFSSFDTYLAPYVYKDKLSYNEVKQSMQKFIFNMNIPSRWGAQTPFSNLTLDWKVPDDLKNQVPMCDSEPLLKNEPHLTYSNFQNEMDMINKAFLEVMIEGDSKGRIFTFPIPTYNITEDFEWEGENVDLLFLATAKYGIPYFQNFVGSQYIRDKDGNLIEDEHAYKPGAVRSMCCRLQLDLTELLKRGGGLFGSAEMTGSVGVVTINAARLGYLNKGNKLGLYSALEKLMILAKDSLEMKRKVLNKYMKVGLYPFTKRYLGTLKNHFSTIGVNGMNELIRNFTNDEHNMTTTYGQQLAKDVLNFMREKIKSFQQETGNLYNLEATPAEGTCYKLAREDRKRFPDILQAGAGENFYYTNSSQIPVGFTDDPFEALELQDELQRKYTGGTVLHFYMGESFSNALACKNFVKRVIFNYRLPYITITPTFSICPEHGYISGEHQLCPKCADSGVETECEVWTRVMGYFRPVSQFNVGKKGEYKERLSFRESKTKNLQLSEIIKTH